MSLTLEKAISYLHVGKVVSVYLLFGIFQLWDLAGFGVVLNPYPRKEHI